MRNELELVFPSGDRQQAVVVAPLAELSTAVSSLGTIEQAGIRAFVDGLLRPGLTLLEEALGAAR